MGIGIGMMLLQIGRLYTSSKVKAQYEPAAKRAMMPEALLN